MTEHQNKSHTTSELLNRNNLTDELLSHFDTAAGKIDIDKKLLKILRNPSREFLVNLPVQLDNGEIHIFPSYRIQHQVANGPMQGGLRYRPDVTIDEMRALALWAACTCAVVNIPFGGSMGGIVCDAQKLSTSELERLTRRYISEMLDIVGPERDIIAPDLSTDQQVMAWIMDTYSMHARHTVTSIVTGKPLELGGSHCSVEAIGYGATCVINEAVNKLGMSIDKTRINIQGAGRRGGSAAALLYAEGYPVTAIADLGGGLYNPNGLNIPDVLFYFAENKTLAGYKEAEIITDEELFALEGEVLLPAFRQEQITHKNVQSVKCRILCEAAYGAATTAAQLELEEKGVFTIPAILGEGGGAIVRYFEWVQNRTGFRWRRDVVMERLKDKITTAFFDVVDSSEKRSVSLREGAYILALKRMAHNLALRGIYG